jgi:hypothetical protein
VLTFAAEVHKSLYEVHILYGLLATRSHRQDGRKLGKEKDIKYAILLM